MGASGNHTGEIPLPHVAVVGCFQNGKSSLVDCLLDGVVARPGMQLATTRRTTRYRYGETRSVHLLAEEGQWRSATLAEFFHQTPVPPPPATCPWQAEMTLWRPLLRDICLIDTPGFDSDGQDTAVAAHALDGADYALLVLGNQRTMTQAEVGLATLLGQLRLPFAAVMNCTDRGRWHPDHPQNRKIAAENQATLRSLGLHPDPLGDDQLVHCCNVLWFLHAAELAPDMEHAFREAGLSAADLAAAGLDRATVWDDAVAALAKRRSDQSLPALLEASGVLPVRRFLEEKDWTGVAADCVRWKGSLYRLVREWESRLGASA